MKKLFNGFIMAFTMYTTIPMKNIWDEKALNLILPMLPIVGIIIGGLWFLLANILIFFKIPFLITCVLFSIIPLLLTGGIHIDGYMDTCDAIFSRTNLDKKRLILKDSNVGAFAVIAVLVLFLLNFASSYEFLQNKNNLIYVIFIPIISRAITIIITLKTKLIFENGFIATFTKDTPKKYSIFLIIFIIFINIIGFLIDGINLFILLIMGIISCIFAGIYCIKQLDGISGDLCGFMIVICESFMLILCAILGG